MSDVEVFLNAGQTQETIKTRIQNSAVFIAATENPIKIVYVNYNVHLNLLGSTIIVLQVETALQTYFIKAVQQAFMANDVQKFYD